MEQTAVLFELDQKLIRLAQEEASTLRQIAQEGIATGKDHGRAARYADRLEEDVAAMRTDLHDPAQPGFVTRANRWGAHLGSIYRIIDDCFAGSQYEAAREGAQSALHETGLRLNNLAQRLLSQ